MLVGTMSRCFCEMPPTLRSAGAHIYYFERPISLGNVKRFFVKALLRAACAHLKNSSAQARARSCLQTTAVESTCCASFFKLAHAAFCARYVFFTFSYRL
jgi:hypothetical protein